LSDQLIRSYVAAEGQQVRAPSLQDYVDVGVVDLQQAPLVTAANLSAVNQAILTLSSNFDLAALTARVIAGASVAQQAETQILTKFGLDTSASGYQEASDFVAAPISRADASFNTEWDESLHGIQNAFDNDISTFYANKVSSVSASSPAYIGWRDVNNTETYGVLTALSIVPRSGFMSRTPKTFYVEGYRLNDQGIWSWEKIEGSDRTTINAPTDQTARIYTFDSIVGYRGFRLAVTASYESIASGSPVNLGELEFIVDEVPSLQAYIDAGFEGVSASTLDIVNYLVRAANTDSLTGSDVQTVAALIQQAQLIADVLGGSGTPTPQLIEAVSDLHRVSELGSLASYQAQEAGGVELTIEEINLITGAAVANTGNIDAWLIDIATEGVKPASKQQLLDIRHTDVYIDELVFADEFGNPQVVTAPGKTVSASTMDVVLQLDQAVQATDTVDLIVDGAVVYSAQMDASTIAAGKLTIEGLSVPAIDKDGDNAIDLVVRHTTPTDVTITDPWNIDYL